MSGQKIIDGLNEVLEDTKKRWEVSVDYGRIGRVFFIEELAELHDLIERGPDWNLIERIDIKLNRRFPHPNR